MSRSVRIHRRRLTFFVNRFWLIADLHLRDRTVCLTWRWDRRPVIETIVR